MTHTEALEQVRADVLSNSRVMFYEGSDYPVTAIPVSSVLTILDAVTPDAPVTVEGLLTDRDRMDISAVVHQNYYMPNVFNTVETIVHRHLTPERTEQGREAAVKHDPRAHAKVGDRASSTARVICEAISAEDYWCTRKEGHPGHHIAEDARAVVAVWGREVSE